MALVIVGGTLLSKLDALEVSRKILIQRWLLIPILTPLWMVIACWLLRSFTHDIQGYRLSFLILWWRALYRDMDLLDLMRQELSVHLLGRNVFFNSYQSLWVCRILRSANTNYTWKAN
jgi:hypothetical protein